MELIKAFCSYSSVLSQREYLSIIKSYYKYNTNMLLSLYDIRYYLQNDKNLLRDIFYKANSVFLDSGVYEVETSSRLGLNNHEWDYRLYLDTLKWVLSEFNLNGKLYVSSYDNYRLSLNEQVEASIDSFEKMGSEFDLKDASYVFTIRIYPFKEVDWERSNIQTLVSAFKNPAIIAIPEKELGMGLYDKIKCIKILTSQGFPLHLLGCLDPTHLIIFALAGVRYFDGLNWLKFYFNNKLSYYRNLYELDLIKGNVVDPRSYVINNCVYIDKLINDLEYSIATEDYSLFEEERRILSKLDQI